MKKLIIALLFFTVLSTSLFYGCQTTGISSKEKPEISVNEKANGNQFITSFSEAKKVLIEKIYNNPDMMHTIYCNCVFYENKEVELMSCPYKIRKDKKRAKRVEWEHIVPAHQFGQFFPEWRDGHKLCKKNGESFKGRKCAEKINPSFRKMESDLYNIFPSVGELNADRKNYKLANLGNRTDIYNACGSKIDMEQELFEPANSYKGLVARAYLYMHETYPGFSIIDDSNRKLIKEWNERYPVTPTECERSLKIVTLQGNHNRFVDEGCSKINK